MLGATGTDDVGATGDGVAHVEEAIAVVLGTTGVGAGVCLVSVDHASHSEDSVGAIVGEAMEAGTREPHESQTEGAGTCDVGKTDDDELAGCQADHCSLDWVGTGWDEVVGFG